MARGPIDQYSQGDEANEVAESLMIDVIVDTLLDWEGLGPG